MTSHEVVKLDALFTCQSEQSVSLSIRVANDGTLNVRGLYRSSPKRGYPGREVIEREGKVYQEEAEILANSLRAACKDGWYHHYRSSVQWTRQSPSSWFKIRIEYSDGMVDRWDGVNAAPDQLSAAYDALVSFGMPGLHLAYGDRLNDYFSPWSKEDPLIHLWCYERLFQEAGATGDEVDDDQASLLTRELLEDIETYRKLNPLEMEPKEVLRIWRVPCNAAALHDVHVKHAERIQMVSLFWAISQMDEPVGALLAAVRDGSFGRWCERLREIPQDEKTRRMRAENEGRRQLASSVDEEVRRRIAEGGVFTSHDVALKTGASARQASARIRIYVREGRLQTVGDDYPRRYQAA